MVGPTWLHDEFYASLGYIQDCLNKQTKSLKQTQANQNLCSFSCLIWQERGLYFLGLIKGTKHLIFLLSVLFAVGFLRAHLEVESSRGVWLLIDP